MASTPTNLFEYYTSKGQKLPSVQERAKTFESSGLGKAVDYQGTSEQNTSLLAKLSASPSSTQISGVGTLTITPKNPPSGEVPPPADNMEAVYKRTGVTPPVSLTVPPTPPTEPQLVPVFGTKYQDSPVISSINTIASTLDKISKDILSSKTASDEEKKLAQELVSKKGSLDQFDTETLKKIESYSGAGRGQTQQFVALNQEKERKTRALERLGFAQEVSNITDQLSLAKDERLALGDIAKTEFDIAKSKTDMAMGIFKEMERLDDQEQDDARTYLLDLVDFAKGKTFEELDQLTQAQVISSVADSPITLGMIKSALANGAKPEKIGTSVVEVNGVKKLINDQTGETIKVLGFGDSDNPTSPTSFTSVLAKDQIFGLRAAGLADQTINDITRWLSAGMSLEDIRQSLRAKKIDPKVLDTFDKVVNIKAFLDPSRTQFKSSTGRDA